MNFRIATRPGTGTDGFPTRVYVIEDHKGEDVGTGWWYTWEEAEAQRKRLAGEASEPS